MTHKEFISALQDVKQSLARCNEDMDSIFSALNKGHLDGEAAHALVAAAGDLLEAAKTFANEVDA